MPVVAEYEYELPARKRACQYCKDEGYWIVSTPNGQPVCTECLRKQVATYFNPSPDQCLDPIRYPTYSWRCGKCSACLAADEVEA